MLTVSTLDIMNCVYFVIISMSKWCYASVNDYCLPTKIYKI